MEIRNTSGELIFSDNSLSIKETVINAIGSGADLRWADLREANLSGANLSGANLSGAKGVIYAHISFNWHGEQGRQLSAIKIDDAVVLFCGCFKGSEEDLMAYIERGDETYKQSRTIALNTVMSLIKI